MTTSTRTPTLASSTISATPTAPLGRIIATSLGASAVAAAALTFTVLPDASDATIVGAALAAFGAGWAMLAWLTTRRTAAGSALSIEAIADVVAFARHHTP
jgi:hypothetical protein